MKATALIALGLSIPVWACAADSPAIESLIDREFVIHDDWAGQELAFKREGQSLHAIWRVLGSGRPVISETAYPVEIASPRRCVFDAQLRGQHSGHLKVELGDNGEVKIYLNGVKISSEEKRTPKTMPTTGGGAS